MLSYETLFITHPDLTPEESAAMTQRMQDIITSRGGEVDKVEEWGKRKLAYEIKKVRDGYFTLINFNGNNDILSELDHVYKITEDVLRGIIIKH